MGMEMTLREGEEWVKVASFIWKNITTGKFHYEDEMGDFSLPFESIQDAEDGLEQYIEHLNG